MCSAKVRGCGGVGYLKICVSAGCSAKVKSCEGGGVGAGGCLEEKPVGQ